MSAIITLNFDREHLAILFGRRVTRERLKERTYLMVADIVNAYFSTHAAAHLEQFFHFFKESFTL